MRLCHQKLPLLYPDSLKIRMVNHLVDMAYQERRVACTKKSFILLSIYDSIV